MSVTIDLKYLEKFISSEEFSKFASRTLAVQSVLNSGTGLGSELLGWKDPQKFSTADDLERIVHCAQKIRNNSKAVIVIGTGGSYIGSKAAIDWLVSSNYNLIGKSSPKIYFLGSTISALSVNEVLSLCESKDVSVVVISKSGETLETVMMFRIVRQYMKKRYGDEAVSRIYVITNNEKGNLKVMADEQGYETFLIPADVGGRFSIATAAGLIPMAVAGIDIEEFLKGVIEGAEEYKSSDFSQNPALIYATCRYVLYQKGLSAELFCGWDEYMESTLEWIRQLFAESEGKKRRGLFPSFAKYSADLHSLGQFIQQGSRIVFETMLSVDSCGMDITIEEDPTDFDELNFISGKTLEGINAEAQKAVASAHFNGGVPVVRIIVPEKNAHDFGNLIYFMEYVCALGGYMLGVNPFDQPGVEDYKKNMFGLLGKPGFDKPELV